MKTPRENLLNLLRGKGYDWVPCELNLCPGQIDHFHKLYGEDQDYLDFFEVPMRGLSELVPDDEDLSRFLKYHDPANHIQLEELDFMGVGHRYTPSSMHMTQMYCPLRDEEDEEVFREYPLPSYSREKNAGIRAEVEALHARGLAAVAHLECTVWERSWYIRGMEPLMMDMMCDEETATILLDRVTDTAIQRSTIYAEAGTDIIYLGDDVGMQSTLMMSEELYVKWLKPRLKKVIDNIRRIDPNIIIFYHSCGFVEPLIPHLIDAGIDVLNPVQPECMDFKEIFDKYHGQVAFHGTIGTQTVLPFGTPEDVKAMVKRNLDIAGPYGALFVTPTHMVEPEVPWENLLAYKEACNEYK